MRFDVMAALGLLCTAGVGLGCSSSTNSQPSPSGGTTQSSTGGSGGSGGGASSASATGGTTDHAAGGASAAGGTTDHATGGASAAGGTTDHATGGASAVGGTTDHATGGASAAGGGASATGGSASGGASATGGSASGGASKTGGSTAGGAGGSAGGAGGTGPQGGTTSAGGSSAGGSSGTTSCAARVLSLSSNATGSAADTAYAHVEVDMKTDLPVKNAARTVEFWAFIKKTDWVGEKNEVYYIGPATGATPESTFGLDFGTNNVTGSTSNHATLNPFTNGLNDDTGADLGINSSTDQWVHVAMTWDQKALVTYVNGLPKITVNTTATVTALNTAQSTLYIGCNPTNSNCFNGEFSEFRVWNVARSAADILANYKKPLVGDEAGLVGYWKFDDAATATSAADSVTAAGHTAHNGTLTAKAAAQNPTFAAPPAPVPLVCP